MLYSSCSANGISAKRCLKGYEVKKGNVFSPVCFRPEASPSQPCLLAPHFLFLAALNPAGTFPRLAEPDSLHPLRHQYWGWGSSPNRSQLHGEPLWGLRNTTTHQAAPLPEIWVSVLWGHLCELLSFFFIFFLVFFFCFSVLNNPAFLCFPALETGAALCRCNLYKSFMFAFCPISWLTSYTKLTLSCLNYLVKKKYLVWFLVFAWHRIFSVASLFLPLVTVLLTLRILFYQNIYNLSATLWFRFLNVRKRIENSYFYLDVKKHLKKLHSSDG